MPRGNHIHIKLHKLPLNQVNEFIRYASVMSPL